MVLASLQAILKVFTGKFRPNGFSYALKFALHQVEEAGKLDALCNINPQILAHSGIYTELCPQASNNTKMKIFAVGMNYAQHNLTLHEQAERPETPVIFTKCDTALLKDDKPFFIPDHLGSIEYEAELVVRICKLGKTIPVRFAHRYYDAVTVGIDFTARDLQKKLREAGQPWDLCKGFDGSAVLGEWVSTYKTKPVQQLRFRLDVNGKSVQEGYSGDMLYTVDEIIAYISRYFTLRTGDLLFTGCPSGCGPVRIDDHLEGYLEDKKVLAFNCK